MHLPAPNEREFELAPAGTHLAVCYRVIDLGTQDSSYNGQAKRQHKILISWEIPDEKMSDGRPFTISQRYTWSMSEKAALRRDLESWRGKPFSEADFGEHGFDIQKIIGVGCLLTIVHNGKNGKTYANISAIGKLMKGMQAPALSNPQAYLWINVERWNPEAFSKLSQGLQAAIMKSPEYAQLVRDFDTPGDQPPPNEASDFHDDPIPGKQLGKQMSESALNLV